MFDGEGVAKKMFLCTVIICQPCVNCTNGNEFLPGKLWEGRGRGGGDSRYVPIPQKVSLADRRFPYTHLGQPEMICLCERG